MANPLFPIDLRPEFGGGLPETFKTIRTPPEASKMSVVRKWRFSKVRNAKLSFLATLVQLDAYRAFWVLVSGGGVVFDFRGPWEETLTGVYIGVGDGSTTVFQVPIYHEDSMPNFYVDGVLQVVPFDLEWFPMLGDNQRSMIEFQTGSVPADGAVITEDEVGGQRMLEVYGQDVHDPQEIGTDLFRITVVLDEV